MGVGSEIKRNLCEVDVLDGELSSLRNGLKLAINLRRQASGVGIAKLWGPKRINGDLQPELAAKMFFLHFATRSS